MRPAISVCLPVYNGIQTLPQAVESIRAQSFGNWELILLDDGSTDGSRQYLRSLRGTKNIRVHYHEKNLGLSRSLNHSLGLAQGQLIARMDQDDVSLPDRLKIQYETFQRHARLQVLGAQMVDMQNRPTPWRYPTSRSRILCRSAFGSPFAHPTVMMRKGVASYRPQADYAEDWDLWNRLGEQKVDWGNLSEPLLKYRHSPGGMSRQGKARQQKARSLVAQDILRRLKIPGGFRRRVAPLLAVSQPQKGIRKAEMLDCILAMLFANQRHGIYPRADFAWECFGWFAKILFR